MSETICLRSFDVNDLTTERTIDIKNNDNLKIVPVKYKNRIPQIQSPAMYTYYGISKFDSLDLSLSNNENKKSIDRFYNLIKTLDDWSLHFVYNNVEELFEAKYNIDELKDMLVSSIKITDNGNIFRINCSKKNNKYEFPAFNEDKELLDLQKTDTKKHLITLIIKLKGLWINKNDKKFGFIWRIHQLKLGKQMHNHIENTFAFKEEEDRLIPDDYVDDSEDSDLDEIGDEDKKKKNL